MQSAGDSGGDGAMGAGSLPSTTRGVDDDGAEVLRNSGTNMWLALLRAVFPIACCTPDEAETDAGLERAKNVSGSFLGGGSFISDGLEVNSIGVSVELATAFQTEDATYEVSVCTTKSVADASNTAPVWVCLMGDRGRTARVRLLSRDAIIGGCELPGVVAPSTEERPQLFKQGVVVTMVVKAKPVGRLVCCMVGLDDTETGSSLCLPTWHLDFLRVQHHASNQDYFFPCNRWLSRDRENGFLCRILRAYDQHPHQRKCKYRVTFHTSDVKGARCDSPAAVTLYGQHGCSGRREIIAFFERGATDSFEFGGLDIGRVTCIRVGHNGKGVVSPSWHLSNVHVENLTTHVSEEFHVNRWFDHQREDGVIEREIFPAGILFQVHQTVYKITLYTGRQDGDGKQAAWLNGSMLLELHGTKGQAGPLLLNTVFESDSGVAVFLVRALEVGPLLAARVWMEQPHPHHHGSHPPPAVASILDHLEVFCHRLHRLYHFDKRTMVARTGASAVLEPVRYSNTSAAGDVKIVFYTSDIVHAGTNAHVSIQVLGDDGESEVLALGNGPENFSRAGVDEFRRSVGSVGRIRSAIVSHDGSGVGKAWHLEQLEITDLGSDKTYFFPCNRWLDRTYGSAELKLDCSTLMESPEVRYRVQVKTSGFRGAGTSSRAKVTLILYGERGNTGRCLLHRGFDSFSRNAWSTFFISAPNSIGKIYKAILAHDSSGFGAGWHVDMMEVVNCITGENCIFELKCWLDKDTGVIAKEVWPVGRTAPPNMIEYKVVVWTGSHLAASSSAMVGMVLIGSRGRSQALHLAGHRFKRGKSLTFQLHSEPVGELQQLEVTHFGTSKHSSWQLKGIVVSYVTTAGPQDKYFPAGRWFVEGKRSATLTEGTEEDMNAAAGGSRHGSSGELSTASSEQLSIIADAIINGDITN